jgi:hypothetical protein
VSLLKKVTLERKKFNELFVFCQSLILHQLYQKSVFCCKLRHRFPILLHLCFKSALGALTLCYFASVALLLDSQSNRSLLPLPLLRLTIREGKREVARLPTINWRALLICSDFLTLVVTLQGAFTSSRIDCLIEYRIQFVALLWRCSST